MMFALKAKRAFLPYGIENDVIVVIDKDRIVSVGKPAPVGCPVIALPEVNLLPGFIDVHIHGRAGCDVMDATSKALETIATALPKTGVTAWVGTTVTANMPSIFAALACVRRYIEKETQKQNNGAVLLGSFLEGPFFTEVFRGAHPSDLLQTPTKDQLTLLLEAAGPSLLRAAIAPELTDAFSAITWLVEQGVKVSIAHSGATFDEVTKAHQLGADCGVHLFNGMSGLHHREPGCAGGILYHNMLAEIIADGVHVHPAMMTLTHKMKGYKQLALITDCMRAGGLPDGAYMLGEQEVNVHLGQARTQDGSLAGSTISMDQALRNAIELAHIPEWEAVQMASAVPADYLGIKDMGRIATHAKANLTLTDDKHQILATLVNGQWAYIDPLFESLKFQDKEFQDKAALLFQNENKQSENVI